MDIYTWVTIAKKKIRLPIRRAKFKKEIFRRYRCRLETLTEAGMDPEEAKKAAIAELGDPVETGEMAQVLYRQHWMPLPEPGLPYMQKNVYIWANTAARQLLSRRKRNELRRATGSFYRARVKELTAEGMEQREAEKLAMAGFGDPKQIGRAARRRDGLLLMPLTLRYWKPEEKTGLDQFARWLSKAVKPVNFPPDRSAVEQELVEHFEERVEGLTSHGMNSVEAMQTAVERLGSPEETGALFRQVYKPWLGWMLRAARILLVLLVLLGLYRSSDLKQRVKEKLRDKEFYQFIMDRMTSTAAEENADVLIRRGTCDDEGVLYGHRVRVSEACSEARYVEKLGYFIAESDYMLQVDTPPWTAPDTYTIERHLRVLDGSGEKTPYAVSLLYQNLTTAWYGISVSTPGNPDKVSLQYEDETSRFSLGVRFAPKDDAVGLPLADNEPEEMDALFESILNELKDKKYIVTPYTAEPAQADGLTLSVRRAVSCQYNGGYAWKYYLELELCGPAERIPWNGLMGLLHLTDANGEEIGFGIKRQSFCGDRVYCIVEPGDWRVHDFTSMELNFVYGTEGEALTLQLVPAEGE